ncbi:Hypothetical predicted protein [Mytilus galloprovincialis]|uniref:Endonuclease/exonuclease/phosphatase domain-containing protein n=1 Tax=Mytilus galloprovincialis TaxID=29158 RepID=A0A8B6C6H3_MYTGA|nr:Hypothetical predicted protein [Mytilus galloprovincialis]
MPDGNNRIQVITINSSPLKTCLVNVYMPSLQVAGDLDYKDTLDQISEIIEKYKDSYQTIICGDMNASLHRDNRRRDQNFKEFMSNNNLSLANRYPKAPTFFHHNGKPNWAKCDTNIYTSTLKQELECESRRKESSVEERIKLLEKSIHKAGKKSIPKYRQLKSLKTVGKGIWNRKISEASRDSKNAHTLWKRKINSHQNADTEKINLTSKKRKLRQLQRQAYASKKEKFINDIMQASQKDSKTFHKLVKQQRSKHDTNTDILYIGNKAFEGEKILSAWQTHFETLGTPNFDENIFDLERLELSKLQNNIIPELDIQNKEITKATPTEIESAIRKIKYRKSFR